MYNDTNDTNLITHPSPSRATNKFLTVKNYNKHRLPAVFGSRQSSFISHSVMAYSSNFLDSTADLVVTVNHFRYRCAVMLHFNHRLCYWLTRVSAS